MVQERRANSAQIRSQFPAACSSFSFECDPTGVANAISVEIYHNTAQYSKAGFGWLKILM